MLILKEEMEKMDLNLYRTSIESEKKDIIEKLLNIALEYTINGLVEYYSKSIMLSDISDSLEPSELLSKMLWKKAYRIILFGDNLQITIDRGVKNYIIQLFCTEDFINKIQSITWDKINVAFKNNGQIPTQKGRFKIQLGESKKIIASISYILYKSKISPNNEFKNVCVFKKWNEISTKMVQ